MGLMGRIFGRRDDQAGEQLDDEPAFDLDLEVRRTQLQRLELALDALAGRMREVQSVDNPGWRGRINEYNRLAGEAMTMRRGVPTREGLLDLIFEVRPVVSGDVPEQLASLLPLQQELFGAADDLRELRPGEGPEG